VALRTSARIAPGASDCGACPADQGHEPCLGDGGQMARSLSGRDQVGGALREDDRAINPLQPSRDVAQNAPPQHLPEGVPSGELQRPWGAGAARPCPASAVTAPPHDVSTRHAPTRAPRVPEGRAARSVSAVGMGLSRGEERSTSMTGPDGDGTSPTRAWSSWVGGRASWSSSEPIMPDSTD
jgi:hypothetical protein